MSDDNKESVLEAFKEFDGLTEDPHKQELDGTSWRIIYNDSRLSALHGANAPDFSCVHTNTLYTLYTLQVWSSRCVTNATPTTLQLTW